MSVKCLLCQYYVFHLSIASTILLLCLLQIYLSLMSIVKIKLKFLYSHALVLQIGQNFIEPPRCSSCGCWRSRSRRCRRGRRRNPKCGGYDCNLQLYEQKPLAAPEDINPDPDYLDGDSPCDLPCFLGTGGQICCQVPDNNSQH